MFGSAFSTSATARGSQSTFMIFDHSFVLDIGRGVGRAVIDLRADRRDHHSGRGDTSWSGPSWRCGSFGLVAMPNAMPVCLPCQVQNCACESLQPTSVLSISQISSCSAWRTSGAQVMFHQAVIALGVRLPVVGLHRRARRGIGVPYRRAFEDAYGRRGDGGRRMGSTSSPLWHISTMSLGHRCRWQ